jgi:hypothetical protein
MHPSQSMTQRCNFTAAIARLAGLGVRDEAFSSCELAIMSLALETSGIGEENTIIGLELLPLVQV